jgi:TRAP-type C4-dicarboxylate transport system permease small subunit
MLNRFSDWTARALLTFSATLAFLLSFLVVADVIGRVAFNAPVQGTPEIVSMAIVVICFLQAGYAIRSGGMLQVTAVSSLLPTRGRAALAAFGCLLGALFFGVILYGGYEPLLHAWRSGEYEGEGALRVPAWPARLTVLVGSALALLAYVLAAVANLRSVLGLAGGGTGAGPMNTGSPPGA